MKQHYVIFFSPGTFSAEQTQLEIDSWGVKKAINMSKEIKERHSATPYGFYFITKLREDNELDSREVARSNFYFLGGVVKTLKEIENENDPNNSILISNMRCNGHDKIVVNTNSWKWTQLFNESDIILNIDDYE